MTELSLAVLASTTTILAAIFGAGWYLRAVFSKLETGLAVATVKIDEIKFNDLKHLDEDIKSCREEIAELRKMTFAAVNSRHKSSG